MALADLTDWLNDYAGPSFIWYAKRLSGNDTLANGSPSGRPVYSEGFSVQDVPGHQPDGHQKSPHLLRPLHRLPCGSPPGAGDLLQQQVSRKPERRPERSKADQLRRVQFRAARSRQHRGADRVRLRARQQRRGHGLPCVGLPARNGRRADRGPYRACRTGQMDNLVAGELSRAEPLSAGTRAPRELLAGALRNAAGMAHPLSDRRGNHPQDRGASARTSASTRTSG